MRIGNKTVYGRLDADRLDVLENNIMVSAFYRATDNSKTIFNLNNAFMDEYEDESGVDNVNSVNEDYDSANDSYSPTAIITSDTKLLLHCDGADESTTFTDVSLSAHGDATVTGDAKVDTTNKKWGTGALELDGTGDSLSYADSNDWDIFGSNSDNWTIDLWVRHTSSGTTAYFSQFVDTDNFWEFYNSTGGIKLYVKSGGSVIIFVDGGGAIGADSTWYHIAMCKVGSEYGIYKDGVQIGYVSDASTVTYSGSLFIGSLSTIADYLAGHMDEMRIIHTNDFSASPNVGLTDTITVPITAYSTYNAMTLISESQTAESAPDDVRLVLFEEEVNSITLNTDLLAYVSRDGGTTWTQGTLANYGNYESGKRILACEVDISSQPSDTNMEYKLVTANEKALKIHGIGMNW